MDALDSRRLSEEICEAIALLPHSERWTIILRFGLFGEPPHTLKQIGDELLGRARGRPTPDSPCAGYGAPHPQRAAHAGPLVLRFSLPATFSEGPIPAPAQELRKLLHQRCPSTIAPHRSGQSSP